MNINIFQNFTCVFRIFQTLLTQSVYAINEDKSKKYPGEHIRFKSCILKFQITTSF